jgi:hypothetical protein
MVAIVKGGRVPPWAVWCCSWLFAGICTAESAAGRPSWTPWRWRGMPRVTGVTRVAGRTGKAAYMDKCAFDRKVFPTEKVSREIEVCTSP